MKKQSISVRHDEFKVDLFKGGTGKPLLFLHGISGLEWTPFLERLSTKHTVIAPRSPGFGESTGIELLDDVMDVVFFYLDLLDELNLYYLPVIGHSIGGMFAAE